MHGSGQACRGDVAAPVNLRVLVHQVFQSTAEAVSMDAERGASCYLMPVSPTYPAIDALKTPAILFQVRTSPVFLVTSPFGSVSAVPIAATPHLAKPAGPTDEGGAQIAAGRRHEINRPGLFQLVQAFRKDRMKAAVRDLWTMTGLTTEDMPGCKPVLFFATVPESFDDGYKALQKYVKGKVGVQHLSVCCRQADGVLSCVSGYAFALRQWPTAFSAYSSLRLGGPQSNSVIVVHCRGMQRRRRL